MLDFSKLNGLITAAVTDHATGRLLMIGYMNDQAWQQSRETGFVTFWSRSRNQLWTKGETSGHRLRIVEIRTDCDFDALELRVEPLGPGVCHEGFASCFSRRFENGAWVRADEPTFDPEAVYTI
jgi:phosphoribosyl-AMP cyclohydrolase